MGALAIIGMSSMLGAGPASADQIRIVVASNFRDAAKEIVARFESQTRHKVTLITGSTGKLYAQIIHGAPFDAFFSADSERPKRLEQEGLVVPGSRFTYATGRLVLWSPNVDLVDSEGRVLRSDRFRYLAIANPKLAPYGRAAEQALRQLGLWKGLRGRMVRGENIGQAFGFVSSGNAELGLVANAQLVSPKRPQGGSLWEVPVSLYNPIEQQAVLLRDNVAARVFMDFVNSDEMRAIIRAYGYDTP
jgi:molybdate transport system substrate-binding protein